MKTLLIFDDFSTQHQKSLPSSQILGLSILVTSKDTSWKGSILPIEPFSKLDALAILKEFLEDKKAHAIASNLDLFMQSPLALIQAAHCIQQSNIEVETYLKALEHKKNLTELFSALWQETAKAILQQSKNRKVCIALAKLCACSSSPISKQHLISWLQKTPEGQNLDPEEDPIHIVLRDFLTELKKFFLIEDSELFVFIAPLIAEGIRTNIIKEELPFYTSDQ